MKKTLNLKNIVARTVVSIAAILVLGTTFTSCKKSTGSPNPQPGGSDKLYPATQDFYNNIQYPEKSEFKYDGDHNLMYMGNPNRYLKVNSGSTELVVINRDTLINSYSFDRNIYTEKGFVNATNLARWRYSGGLPPYQSAETKYSFITNATNGQITSANLGKISTNLTYDDKGNVTSVTYVTNAWGSPNSTQFDPGGLVQAKLTFKGYDDKPSPYSSIAGYHYISFLWSYPHQFYFAHSKNNPTQIIEESLDTNTMRYKITSQVDITYTYNDQGYPTEVNTTTSNPSAANQTYYQNYKFTYTK